MDIQLPDVSGTEATRRLKSDKETRAIPGYCGYSVCYVWR
jgi:CheY-like chemotaxis protein